MILHNWRVTPYETALKQMDEVHLRAVKEKKNHLILCQHPEVFTLGQDAGDKTFEVEALKTDRGGSITCDSPSQNIYYFCFQSSHPARFFSKVVSVFESFFECFLPSVAYDTKYPGFYIQSHKLSSLELGYREGVSLHGVALNVDVDLAFHNLVNPCGLEEVRASSLEAEGLKISCEAVDEEVIKNILRVFDESLQT